jgi:hypothetical protein
METSEIILMSLGILVVVFLLIRYCPEIISDIIESIIDVFT